MNENDALAGLTPEQQSAELINFLDRFGWALASGVQEKALRYLLRGASFVTLANLSDQARMRGAALTSADLYRMWLEEVDPRTPNLYAAWFNLGVELASRGDKPAAAVAYRNSLVLKPDMHAAAVNLGLLHESEGRPDRALEIWASAIQPDDARTTVLNQRGRLLETLGRLYEAEAELFRSLLTDPHQFDAFTHWLHIRLKMCAWPAFGSGLPGLSKDDMVAQAGGLSLLALFDDNQVVNEWVSRWLQRRLPTPPERLAPENGYAHKRIRIGYLSSDFCLHPISMLTAELFERHDREHFEVYGYCSSPDDGSYLRKRVLEAFDKVTVIRGMSDEAAARAIRADEIDILVDLNGLTEGTRMGVVRWRPAPVQVTYLGFVGSQPVPELDYHIADEFVVPPELAGDFHPKPLYLSRCYQVNDNHSPIGEPETREQVGLPADKFIYCSFSNTYKITEEVFDCWMRVLSAVENSVLWVLARNTWSQENMRARAARHGVSPDRLIFAGPTTPAQYMSRLALADVFLDTFPYNSGTTASDALRMGLPIVTLCGKTFSSRMAGSLLRAMGAEQGIATSFDEYVEVAAALGNDPQRYRAFRDAVSGDAWKRTLGDIEGFVAELEQRFRDIRLSPEKKKRR